MIATILPSSTNFHAVEYNERKVAEGKAELVEMLNFGYISNMGEYSTEDLITFLNDYSAKNNRIQKPQFHIAFSCKGHEMTHEQLVSFARRYMNEMGYGQQASTDCCSRVRMKELGSPLPKLSNTPSHPSLSIWLSSNLLDMSATKRMVILSSSEQE